MTKKHLKKMQDEAQTIVEQSLHRIQQPPRNRMSDGRDAWSQLKRAADGKHPCVQVDGKAAVAGSIIASV